MKEYDINAIDTISGKQIQANESFNFKCHSGLSCFTQCCHNINLFLHPYDVIRLTKNLNISSDQFLDSYTDVILREGNFFPDVLLKMTDQKNHPCPFLHDNGCSVYLDRPETCRSFPLEQGIICDHQKNQRETIYFFRPRDFCLGPQETTAWTPKTWLKDQHAEKYTKMAIEWASLKYLFRDNPWGQEGPYGPKARMAFMAIYNRDSFKSFVFQSSFLKRFKVKTKTISQIKKDDVEFIHFAFDWVKLFLWGISSPRIKT